MIYLDSAATSFQKPETVGRAMETALREMSSPGRGGYPAAMRAAQTLLDCRTELAELFHVPEPEQVVFTMNATHGLNLAIKSLIPYGGRAVISGYEHNAVTRPLAALGADIRVAAAPLFEPDMTAAAFDKAITPDVDAVICTHVSNVFGAVQPIEQVAALCRERGVPLIVDASQSAGVLPLDMTALGAAFIAMPGHKGLYGPQGTGVLLCCGRAETAPLIEGGTGSVSIQQEMPDFLPDRLEAGTHNVPGIAGLLAGVRFVRERGLEQICLHERKLALRASEGLRSIPGVSVCARRDLFAQTGVLSFVPEGQDAELVGNALAEAGVAVRAGMHCAPLAHRTAGTLDSGTVRLSFSAFNTPEEVDRFLAVLPEALRGRTA
ncbi:aminotransferase class V-fold PLP-dependent enzyme [uncultured Oscillibacter sp.]|uniref:aminotransferase class V-fold PLP-dependent enzyme n=1 Tax=uncultured Oscillibacter sp. TaxID=876091 RepID=UPI0025F813B1|nr:aminotransferase class V-fold PLP-dependent enzyme [uncultured Oscillibacter sp.]